MSVSSRRGRLVVLAGPSGVGKSSVVARLRELLPDLWFSVSMTTRLPRPGEVDGRDYHFVTAERFRDAIAAGDLLEWAEIHGGTHRSGTPREPVELRLAAGRPALVELDLQGARNLREALPEALTVFIAPPSWDVLVSRLVGRGTESDEVVRRRLETARRELAASDEFDVVVVNEDVEQAAEQLLTLLTGPDPRVEPRTSATGPSSRPQESST
ncbi:guanylate kinase [Actinoalloteichus hymeniacidonis]|uniref:Guanylate kinase n=1 Tax=Actinoalloteichus hymeniacidonis TaxID=340345 RepID=A0AAC9HPD8_9PSEU|nr:guanylate kinase [Actinoalloteichus hymeniacidonis]AOS63117.1 guanylate kinase [Actinoalloteichus hymeniacidonis]MBB5908847.1 guanylate kinase [Actinoalloteichus hymeniacidonis]